MDEAAVVRNAFVVAPNGDVSERAFDQKWSPLVNTLESLRNDLKRAQASKSGV